MMRYLISHVFHNQVILYYMILFIYCVRCNTYYSNATKFKTKQTACKIVRIIPLAYEIIVLENISEFEIKFVFEYFKLILELNACRSREF